MAEHPHDASDPSSDDLAPPFVGERTYLPPRPRVRREATLGTFNDEQWPGGDAVPDATPPPCPRPATECWWHLLVHFRPLAERTRDGCLFCADDARRAALAADPIAAAVADRDDARERMYAALGDMLRTQDRCAELRRENGLTFKKLCDAATLAGVREQERDEARAEVAILREQLTEASDFGGRESERVDALSAHLEGAETITLGAKEEARDVRAALAASQTREAALRAALGWIVRHDQWCREQTSAPPNLDYWADHIGTPALADPSPASDALGRVARAAVRAVQAEWEPDRATLDQARIAQRAAVEGLLVVAPHWGEPQGGE